MNAKPVLAPRRSLPTFAAAALSAVIALGLLSAVAGVFQHDGTPLQHVAVAERACAAHAYVSERDACVRAFLAATGRQTVAAR